MANGKEQYFTLRELFRLASSRRFRAVNRSSRAAEFVGFGPQGAGVLGWYESNDEIMEFDPDERQWTRPTIYV